MSSNAPIGNGIYIGFSTDNKALILNPITGALFIERDTGDVYKWDGVAWVMVLTDGGAAVPDATTETKGIVELAEQGEEAAGKVVQSDDGRLEDPRTPIAHSHDWADVINEPTTFTPSAHQSSHNEGGSDELKLDDLGIPDDNTDLNSSTTRHGLLRKLSNDAGTFLDGTGNWSTAISVISKGSATKSGDASTKVFTIAHGMASTPVAVSVMPSSVDALGDYTTDVDSTNITITYQSAPPTGTGNLDYFWIAASAAGGVAGIGEVNTMSNLGSGFGVYKQKNVFDFELKSLVQGTDIALTNNTNDITIAAGANVINTTNTKTMTNKTLTTPTVNGVKFTLPTAKTANYTATLTDYYIPVDATSGNITVTLPAASGNAGLTYFIYKTDASANTVIVDGDGTETINGVSTLTLLARYQHMRVECDGTNWFATRDIRMADNTSTNLLSFASTFVSFSSGQLLLPDAGGNHNFILTHGGNDLAASINISPPLLTASDTMVFQAHTQTMTNKTITAPLLNSYYDMSRIAAPSDPSSNTGRFYIKQVDTNNDGVFVKIKRNGAFVEVQVV